MNKKLILNIENIIESHITLRNRNREAIVTTLLDETGFQILSNDEYPLALNLIFEPWRYVEDIDKQKKFIKGKYYNLFESDADELFILNISEYDKALMRDIIEDVLINVYNHPIGEVLNVQSEIYTE